MKSGSKLEKHLFFLVFPCRLSVGCFVDTGNNVRDVCAPPRQPLSQEQGLTTAMDVHLVIHRRFWEGRWVTQNGSTVYVWMPRMNRWVPKISMDVDKAEEKPSGSVSRTLASAGSAQNSHATPLRLGRYMEGFSTRSIQISEGYTGKNPENTQRHRGCFEKPLRDVYPSSKSGPRLCHG